MRNLFVDGWNSFWHIFFGMISVPFPIIAPFFLLYQFILKYDGNSIIDTAEYGVGALAYILVVYVSSLKMIQKFRVYL